MLKTWLSVGTLSLTVCLMAPAQTKSDPADSARSVVAEIDGKTLNMTDVERKNPTALFQARNSYYEAQKKAMDEFVDQYLLELQAGKEHVTVSELLKLHVDNQIAKDPSEEALRFYYEGLNTAQSFEDTREKILNSVREKRKAKIKTAYMESLHKLYNVNVHGAPPRTEVSLENTPVRGIASAPLTLVEFADFECGFCQQIQSLRVGLFGNN